MAVTADIVSHKQQHNGNGAIITLHLLPCNSLVCFERRRQQLNRVSIVRAGKYHRCSCQRCCHCTNNIRAWFRWSDHINWHSTRHIFRPCPARMILTAIAYLCYNSVPISNTLDEVIVGPSDVGQCLRQGTRLPITLQASTVWFSLWQCIRRVHTTHCIPALHTYSAHFRALHTTTSVSGKKEIAVINVKVYSTYSIIMLVPTVNQDLTATKLLLVGSGSLFM